MTEPFEARLAAMKAAAERKPHGTRARYIGGRCRCVPCRAANSRYETDRLRKRVTGDWNPLVDAQRARIHMKRLSRLGVGRRSVNAASGISGAVLWAIWTGERKQIRKRTQDRILAVDEGARGGNSLVSAIPARKLIRELVIRGYSRAELARRMGLKTPAIQFLGKAKITARNAARVERLYNSIERGVMRPGAIR